MAARPVGVWGIDLGQCALKAIRLEMQDGNIVATAFEYVEHPKILSQPDADPDELTRQALGAFLERNKIAGDLVCISVPGQSGLARFVKLPPVDEKKIADIVKFEAKQQIPFPLEEVVWDFQRLNRGEIVEGMALETEIGLFAMKRDMVMRAIRQFKEVNVEVHMVQMAPLALCNFVAYDLLGKGVEPGGEEAGDDSSQECIVCLEIGTDNSNLVITNGGRIIWQRPIPIGGNHFTRALTKEMKLTFAKAEHLKRNAAKSPDLKKILGALKQVLNDFVGELQRSLGYFTNTHRNAQIQYMVGLGNAFRLPGLQKFLQEKLQLEVRKLQKLERTGGDSVTTAPTFAENIMSFGVAYGLALQGLKQARLQTNLLPYEVRLERVIRGKKPWMVAAAASLLFGMCLIAVSSAMERNAIINEANVKAAAELKKAQEVQRRYENDFKAEQERLEKSEKSLKRIGAGVDERLNWQLLHQYVNLMTPQPNGTRLAIEPNERQVIARKKYWDDDPKAKEAYNYLNERRFSTGKDLTADEAQKRDRIIKENLVQVNIIGINAVYTDDLYPYYKKIHEDGSLLTGMHLSEQTRVKEYIKMDDPGARKSLEDTKAPFKDGWVVELRGYTYHNGPEQFLEATLIENLKYPNRMKDVKLTPEMESKIKNRVGYIHIYKRDLVKYPMPGRFQVIGGGFVRMLVKGGAGVGGIGGGGGLMPAGPGIERGPGGPGPMPGPGGEGGAERVGPNRDSWKPIGEGAVGALGEGANVFAGGGPGGGGVGGVGGFQPQPGEVGKIQPIQPVPRYEFVILFIWREPFSNEPPPAAAGATPGVPPVPTPGVPPTPKS